ncbi:hypothetical protein AVEN_246356-1 [Araneus ventricosus]|uniref:Uncharacterized protein n=1 Tax=Araneus ventricosus TaxID=182803 RepID=A0A4Y2UEF5_ARAVE|nr:hypothetical protein AVEN_246356-1 [Araneus ventricosus]
MRGIIILAIEFSFKFDYLLPIERRFEGGGGPVTAGESLSPSLDSKGSSELISASASDSRDCKTPFLLMGKDDCAAEAN